MGNYVVIVVEINNVGFKKAMNQFVDAPRSTHEEQIDRENAAHVLTREGKIYAIWPISSRERDLEYLAKALEYV